MKSFKFAVLLALILLILLLPACGGTEPAESTPEAAETLAPTPAPTPEPTPTPTPEPPLPAGMAVTVDGTLLASGSVIKNDTEYMRLSEAAEALGFEVTENGEEVSFTWRKREVRFTPEGDTLYYGQQERDLAPGAAAYQRELWVPVRSFCEALDISLFPDEEEGHLYCTPGAGGWELPEGYRVPVLMYHGVEEGYWAQPFLFMQPETMEEQIRYLLDEGYEPIWFEDLWHVEDFEKPVILTFDDGYTDNYENMLPIMEKYQVKATFFICSDFPQYHFGKYMDWDMVRALSESGLGSIQSHSAEHEDLRIFGVQSLQRVFARSRLDITRAVGREPFVLAYPYGYYDEAVRIASEEAFRFGLKMYGPIYVTGDDPLTIARIYMKRDMSLDDLAKELNK